MPLQNGACNQPNPDDVRAELARICASRQFLKAQKLAAFLSLVVDLKLKGKDRNIKGYTIGTLALGRKKDFDPSNNAIVRVMATRLRKTLSTYYSDDGSDDTILIDIPVGTYVPVFRHRMPDGADLGTPDPAPPCARTDLPPPEPDSADGAAHEPDDLPTGEMPPVLPPTPDDRPTSAVPERSPPAVVIDPPGPEISIEFSMGCAPPPCALRRAGDTEAPQPAVLPRLPGAAFLPSVPAGSYDDPDPPASTPRSTPKADRRLGLRTMLITIGVFFAKVSLALAVISVSSGFDNGPPLSEATYSTPLVVAVPEIDIAADRPDLQATRVELRDTLIRALSLFEDVTVLAPTADTAPARFHIESRISGGTDPVLSVRFVRWPGGEVVWAHEAGIGDAEARKSAVRVIASAIGRPGGLANKRLARWREEDATPWERCRLATERYFGDPTPRLHAKAKACLKAIVTVRDVPADASAHARMLSLLARMSIEEHRRGFGSDDEPLAKALPRAQKAAELTPGSAWAWQTVCDAKFYRGEIEAAMPACEQALKANPFDTDIQALTGARLIVKGDRDRGLEELKQALADNPVEPPWYKLWLFLGHWRAGKIKEGEAFLHNLPGDLDAFGQMVMAIAAVEDDDALRAKQAIRGLVALRPEIVEAPEEVLAHYFPEPEFAAAVHSALIHAGLTPE